MTTSGVRRVYHFSPPNFVLENLSSRRLKVSRFSSCNDPFELAAFDLRPSRTRRDHKKWLKDVNSRYGLVCFSMSWHNPVMWSHYAANFTGVCYCIDVAVERLVEVQYVEDRLYLGERRDIWFPALDVEANTDLYATKFAHWRYEQEVRYLVKFPSILTEDDSVFQSFGDGFRLRKIYLGPKCAVYPHSIDRALGQMPVQILKTRLAFKNFSVANKWHKTQGRLRQPRF